MKTFFHEAIQQLDPIEEVDAEYQLLGLSNSSKSDLFHWKAMRMLSSQNTEFLDLASSNSEHDVIKTTNFSDPKFMKLYIRVILANQNPQKLFLYPKIAQKEKENNSSKTTQTKESKKRQLPYDENFLKQFYKILSLTNSLEISDKLQLSASHYKKVESMNCAENTEEFNYELIKIFLAEPSKGDFVEALGKKLASIKMKSKFSQLLKKV